MTRIREVQKAPPMKVIKTLNQPIENLIKTHGWDQTEITQLRHLRVKRPVEDAIHAKNNTKLPPHVTPVAVRTVRHLLWLSIASDQKRITPQLQKRLMSLKKELGDNLHAQVTVVYLGDETSSSKRKSNSL